MTIYFDENLSAYNTKPTLCVGETDDYKWAFYFRMPKNIAWTVRDYQLVDLRDTEEYKEWQRQKEKERVSKLQCTKRVFALMLQELGISYSQLKALIATSEQAQLEWDLCIELERCNPLIDVMAAQMGVTSEQIDLLFKVANGESPVDELRATVQPKDEPETDSDEQPETDSE